jgi:hypothetical protein
MSLVVVCFLAVSGDPSHAVISFPIDPLQNFGHFPINPLIFIIAPFSGTTLDWPE